MKKVVAALVVIAVTAWAVATLTARGARRAALAREWPLGLGTLESVPERFPRQEANDAARELSHYVAKNDPVAARALLLSERPLAWGVAVADPRATVSPDYHAIHTAYLALTAQPGEWEDLRARWQLARALWQRPELTSTRLAMEYTNALADRAAALPRPEPAWFAQVRTFDYRKAMLASMQVAAWMTFASMDDRPVGPCATGRQDRVRNRIIAIYLRHGRHDFAEHRRRAAVAMASGHPAPAIPRWNVPAKLIIPDLTWLWQETLDLERKIGP